MNYFTFDGIDSRTYNTYIATSNAFDAPGREDEIIKVPGSNNIYYLTEGTYKPFDIKLYCYIPSNMQVKTDDLRNFLLSKGTCTYTEAIRPNEFRVARFIEAYEIDVSDRVSAAFVLTFKAQPQRYLTTNTPITTTATADTTTDTTLSLSTVPTPITISLNGNTTQEGSSGKNLIGLNQASYTGTLTNQYFMAFGSNSQITPYNLTANTTYVFSAYVETTVKPFNVTVGCGNGDYAHDIQMSSTYTFSENGRVWVRFTPTATDLQSGTLFAIRVPRYSTQTTFTYKVSDVQLEIGSEVTAYEPHISPTNPQEIHSVSGDNTIHIASKNLLSNDWENDWQRGYWDISTGKFVTSGNWQAIKYYIPVQPNTTYYVYADPNISASIGNICQYDANKNFIVYKAGAKNTTFTTSANVYFLTLYVGNVYKGTNISLSKSDTTTDGTYVPFTTQSYYLYLPVENLLNQIVNPLEGTYTQNYRDITSNQGNISAYDLEVGVTYTFSVDVECSVLPFRIFIGCGTGAYQYDIISQQFTKNGRCAITFTPTSTQLANNRTKLAVRIPYFSASTTFTVKASNMQLEIGSKANHYTPYGTTPIELNKIGTYQDYIYKNGGKWYVHKAITKVDLGTLDSWNNYNDTFYANLVGAIIAPSSGIASILCTSYRARAMANIISKIEDKAIALNTGQSRCNVYDSSYTASTIGNFINSVKGVWLYYPLATPTNTEITDTTLINQLNNIEKAYSYNGTTNILQVSNDNGFMLGVVSLHSNDVSSDYKGEPIITVNSTGLIYFNGCVIKVNQAPMTINSQTMQAYNGTVNLNNYIEADDFPMIEAGNNVIGSEMPLSIVPNYWKL